MTQRIRTAACHRSRAALATAFALLAAPLHAQPAAPGAAPPPAAGAAPVTTAPGNVTAPKNVTVLGLGMMSCQVYGALQQVGAGDIANQWLLGFLSGGGAFAGSNYLGSTSLGDAIKLVQHYCATNPKTSLVAAGLEVAQELEGPVGQMRPK
jgi:hypothetical protein